MEANQSTTNQNLTTSKVQQPKASLNRRLFLVVIIMLTAVVSGGIVYFWQRSVSEREVIVLKQKISSLEKQTSLPEQSPVPTTDSILDWKIYINKDLRYTIRYPEGFKVDELKGVTTFYREKIETLPGSPIDSYLGGFLIYDRSASGKNAKEACDAEACQNLVYGGSGWSVEEIKINNAVGVKVISTQRPLWADYYLAPADGSRIVRIMGGAWSSELNPTQEQLRDDFKLLENIFSSFKFTD